MEWMVENLPLVTLGLILFVVALTLHTTVGRCVRLLGRTGVGIAFLALWSQVGGMLGLSLGVNLFNALVLGLLGIPGFGLLLMMNWALGA